MNNNIFQKATKLSFALALALGLLVPASATLALPQKSKPAAQEISQEIPTDRIIIKYKAGTSALSEPDLAAQMDILSAAAGVTLEYARAMSGDSNVLQLAQPLPLDQVQAISDQLMTLPDVEYALPDRIVQPTIEPTPYNPNDTKYSDGSQWNLNGANGINAPTAWGVTKGSPSNVVAVIDTGLAPNTDLTGRTVTGYDFVSNAYKANDGDGGRDIHPEDPGNWIDSDDLASGNFTGCSITNSTWHGTHVAGTIGATGDNSSGVAGIDWNTKILPVRVLGKCGGYFSDVIDGMRWAAGLDVSNLTPALNPGLTRNTQYPAKVINLSLGVPGACEQAEQDAINEITAAGAVVVVAAGNDGSAAADASSPANCTGVITVAATDSAGNRAIFSVGSSNYGSLVEISAPGKDVLSTSNNGVDSPGTGIYALDSGTSMAAPHVSGVVSLMFDANPRITPAQVLKILQKTATAFPGGSTCTISICGSGIVNAGNAVKTANMPDLIVTGVTSSKTYPIITDVFDVNVSIKNQGGLNLHELAPSVDTVVFRTIFIDHDPSTFPKDPDGCLTDPLPAGVTLGTTKFERVNDTGSIASGDTQTLSISVTGLEGEHQVYAYADVDCNILDESFRDNNQFPPITINPLIHGALTYPEQGSNIGTDYNPIYKWNDVIGATWYHLYVGGPGGVVLDQWFDASLVCGIENGVSANRCAITGGPSATLGSGAYAWYMQSYSPSGGISPWNNNSQPTNFTTIPVAPSAAVLTEPKGTIGTLGNPIYTPTYKWDKVNAATYYRLYVSGPSGVAVDQWYSASSICDLAVVGECAVVSPMLGAGAYIWYVQTYNPGGYGPWSNNTQPTNFSTLTTAPGVAVLTEPMGSIGTSYTPTYKWGKVNAATYYRLYVTGPSGLVLDQWYLASSICGASECSVVSPTLTGGAYSWFVQTYNPAGFGPWSNNTLPTNFSTSTTAPGAAVLTEPIGAIGTTNNPIYMPTYKWNKVGAATYYHLYVAGPSGLVVDKWYSASSICDLVIVGECSVVSPILGAGTHAWYVQTYNPVGYGPWSNNTQPTNFSTLTTAAGAAVLTEPIGAIGTNEDPVYTPTYKWGKVGDVTYYRLYVAGPGGMVLDQWYSASSICVLSECSVASPLLGAGNHVWYVQTYSPAGLGLWSNNTQPTNFSTVAYAIVPTTVDLRDGVTNPEQGQNLGTEHNPTFVWKKADTATWYRLYVAGPSGVVIDQWYSSSVCIGTSCSVASPTTLTGGSYSWYVLTYNSAGYGDWSLKTDFTAPVLTIPKAATNLSPTGFTTNPLTYTWNKDPLATWYRLYVKGPSGVVKDQWYQAASVCSGNCSVVSPTLANGDYTWWVQTYDVVGYGPWKKATFTVTP